MPCIYIADNFIKKNHTKYKSIGMLNKRMSTFSVTAITQHTHDSLFLQEQQY